MFGKKNMQDKGMDELIKTMRKSLGSCLDDYFKEADDFKNYQLPQENPTKTYIKPDSKFLNLQKKIQKLEKNENYYYLNSRLTSIMADSFELTFRLAILEVLVDVYLYHDERIIECFQNIESCLKLLKDDNHDYFEEMYYYLCQSYLKEHHDMTILYQNALELQKEILKVVKAIKGFRKKSKVKKLK